MGPTLKFKTGLFYLTATPNGYIGCASIASKVPRMNWANLSKDFPMAYAEWMQSGEDIWDWVHERGMMGYMYDPSVTGQGYMWEVKYLDKQWNVVSVSDVVLTNEESAFERMMWRIFWNIENNESITMEDYRKADKDFTPENWKKAVEEVEGLMSLYTTEAVARHKRRKFWKTRRAK